LQVMVQTQRRPCDGLSDGLRSLKAFVYFYPGPVVYTVKLTPHGRMQQQTMPWLDIRNISIAIAAAPAPHTSSVMGLSRGNLNRGGRWQGRNPPPEVCVRGWGQAPPPPLGMSAIWLPLEICLDTTPLRAGRCLLVCASKICAGRNCAMLWFPTLLQLSPSTKKT
jgi:hypothetical protein